MSNVTIFGSCVARDTATVMGDGARVLAYVARQSMISAAFGPAAVEGEVRLESNFQKRSVTLDLQGDALHRLAQTAERAEAVLLDLMDERFGVYRAPDGGYLTHTWELVSSGLLEQQPEPLTLIAFGSDEHFELWKRAASIVAERIRELGLPAVLLAPPLADRELQGEALEYQQESIEAWNARFARYYDEAERLGMTVLRPPAELAVADAEHQWGLAPFHYARPMYEWFMQQLEQLSRSAPDPQPQKV